MSGDASTSGHDVSMEPEPTELTFKAEYKGDILAGLKLTKAGRHLSTIRFMIRGVPAALVVTKGVGLKAVAFTILYFSHRMVIWKKNQFYDDRVKALEACIKTITDKLSLESTIKQLVDKLAHGEDWGEELWMESIDKIHLEQGDVPDADLKQLTQLIANTRTSDSRGSSNAGGGGGSSSTAGGNPAVAIGATRLMQLSESYYYSPPSNCITLLGTKEWLSENMKMMQLNGVLVMDDLLGCCWPEAFYRLVTLAQRAQALGQKQQGTGLEQEQQFREQMRMVADPDAYVKQLLAGIAGRTLKQQVKLPTLELQGLSLEEAQELQVHVAAAVKQAGEEGQAGAAMHAGAP